MGIFYDHYGKIAAVLAPTLVIAFNAVSFFDWHDPILVAVGQRATPEARLQAMVEASKCGETSLLFVGKTKYEAIRDCGDVQAFEFTLLEPTTDYAVWSVGYRYGPTREDCASQSAQPILYINDTQRPLRILEGGSEPITDPALLKLGWTRQKVATYYINDQVADRFFGVIPDGIIWDQSWLCDEGAVRIFYPDRNKPFPVEIPKDHIWELR